MRRGNPKKDYNEDGTPRHTTAQRSRAQPSPQVSREATESDDENLSEEHQRLIHDLLHARDKYEAAVIIQPPNEPNTDGRSARSTKRKPNNNGERSTQEQDESNTAARRTRPKPNNDFGSNTFWNRPATSKRKSNPHSSAMSVNSDLPPTHDLIVDTGASHVLFQQKHMHLLKDITLSHPDKKPFAVLRAANGQILTAIGKGVFRVKNMRHFINR